MIFSIKRTTEEQLAAGLRRGKNSAMTEFYAQYAGRLMAVCCRYFTSDDDAKDVMQEALIKIYENADKFEYKGKGSLLAWASRIVVNEALIFIRRNKQITVTTDELTDTAEDVALDTMQIPPEKIQEMIRELPDGYRTVFNLYVFEDMSHKEIAEKLGISAMTSASQLHRAKKLLYDKIIRYKKKGEYL